MLAAGSSSCATDWNAGCDISFKARNALGDNRLLDLGNFGWISHPLAQPFALFLGFLGALSSRTIRSAHCHELWRASLIGFTSHLLPVGLIGPPLVVAR